MPCPGGLVVNDGSKMRGSTEGSMPVPVSAQRWAIAPSTGRTTMRLYRNNRNGTFTDVTSHSGIKTACFGMGGSVGDFNNDGWPDIVVANDSVRQSLYHNRGDGTFDRGLLIGATDTADLAVTGVNLNGATIRDAVRPGAFTVGFVGTLGRANVLETLIDAARLAMMMIGRLISASICGMWSVAYTDIFQLTESTLRTARWLASSGFVVAPSVVGGVKCTHLAFRGSEVYAGAAYGGAEA